MDLKLEGKTAVVTGGSAGIGKGIARALAKEGVDVAICARRKEPLDQAAAEIARETNRRIVPIPADLSKDADAKTLVAQAHKALGRIDILVNNAGSSPGGRNRASFRGGLGAVAAAQIHGLCALPALRVADHGPAGRRPRRQSDR